MPAIFGPRANLAATLAIAGVGALTVTGIGWWWIWPRTDYWNQVRWTVAQPVPFSHEHHVDGLTLIAGSAIRRWKYRGARVCPRLILWMTCHSQIWTNAALLAPVRQSLANNKPIVWNRVTTLPDYVFFNHSIHIAKGVGCSSCHGDVEHMPLTYKAKTLTMQFCVDCHSNPGPRLRPKDQIYNTQWRRNADTPSPETLLAEYHLSGRTLTDCSICHR